MWSTPLLPVQSAGTVEFIDCITSDGLDPLTSFFRYDEASALEF